MASQLNAARRPACSLLALLSLMAAAGTADAQQLGSLADEYRQFVLLGQSSRNRAEMDNQYLKLSRMAPSDATIPYTHALLLTGQRKYRDAIFASGQAIAIDGNNLNAWKLHIWLQLQNEKFAPALKSVTKLAEYMPDVDATGRRRAKGEQMAEYFGTVFGYIAIPRHGELPKYNLRKHAGEIRTYLTTSQQKSFARGVNHVKSVYGPKYKFIQSQRKQAYGADVNSREAQVQQMADERARIQSELDGIEELRLKGKALATMERNTLAATRDQSRAATYSATSEDEVNVYRSRGVGGPGRQREVNDYWSDSVAAAAKRVDRGFGEQQYDSVTERNAAYDRYLSQRGDTLLRQLQVMERKEVALRKKSANGSSSRVARLERKSKLLTAYMALPVDPQTEVTALLAKLDRYYPAGPVAQTLAP